MEFGANLKIFREKAGLSQGELAKTLNTDVETLAGF